MIKKLQTLLILLFCFQNLNSQTINAAEIFYTQIDSFKYAVKANLYRNCAYNPLQNVSGYIYADSIKLSMNFKRISIENISDTCGNPCNIQNYNSNPGFEKHTYVDTINLKSNAYKIILEKKLCHIYFAINQDIRHGGLTTMDDYVFYIDAMVNICHQGSFIQSPEFNIKPKMMNSCNQPIVYNPGILNHNIDDSLSFELAPIEYDKGKYVSYKGSFSLQYPVTPYCPPNPGVINCRGLPGAKPPRGFYFDKDICNVQYTPTNCDEVSIIKFKMNQYRYNPQTQKNELIGYVQREMIQQTIVNTYNNPPEFSVINKHGVCENSKICFSIKTRDDLFNPYQKKADTVDLNWNYGIPGAVFKIKDSSAREKEAEICYTPQQLNNKFKDVYFAVKAEDKNCHSFSSTGFKMTVFPLIKSKPHFQVIKGCNMIAMNNEILGDTDQLGAKLLYTYIIKKISPQQQTVYSSALKKDTFRFNSSGRYVIESYIRQLTNCYVSNFDTFDLEAAFPLDLGRKDSLVCVGDTVILGNKDYNQNLSKISWEFPLGTLVSDSAKTFQFVQNGANNMIRMRYKNNFCNLYQDVTIYSQSDVIEPRYKDSSVCKNYIINLDFKTIIPYSLYQALWIVNEKDSFYSPTLNNFKIDSNKRIKVILIKNPKCTEETSFSINTKQNPEFYFTDSVGCVNDSTLIKPQYIKHNVGISKYNWRVNNLIYNSKDSQIKVLMNTNKNIKLELTDQAGCITTKSVNYKMINPPDFNFKDSLFCKNMNFNIQPQYHQNNLEIVDYQWKINQQISSLKDSNIIVNMSSNQALELRITDIKGCKKSKNIILKTRPSIDFSLVDSISCDLFKPFISIKSNTINKNTKIEWWIDGQLDTTKQLKYFNSFTQPLKIDVKLKDTNNCINEKTIQTPRIARPKFTFPNIKFCANQIVTYQPSYSSVKPIVFRSWFVNGENKYSSDNKYFFKTKDSIELKHIIKDNDGCVFVDSILLKPTIPIVKIKGDTIYNHNDFVKLEADQTFNSYLWNNNTTLKTNHFSAKLLGPPGIYPIRLIAFYNQDCKDTANINIHILPSSNIKSDFSSFFKFFPNPNNGILNLETHERGLLELYALNGQLLLSQWLENGPLSIDLNHLQNGVYAIKWNQKVYRLVLMK